MFVTLYPAIPDPSIAADLFNRIAWGLNAAKNLTVYYQIAAHQHWEGKNSFPVSDSPKAVFLPSAVGIKFQPIQVNMEKDAFLESSALILVWRAHALQDDALRAWHGKLVVIDPYYHLNHEADQIAALQYSLMAEKAKSALREKSLNIFNQLHQRHAYCQSAKLYLTGPSLQQVLNSPPTEESVRLICNSLVKDQAMLAAIRPQILCFADPAYHFGISLYAEAFRKEVYQALKNYPQLMCILPERYLPLIQAYFAHEMDDRLIGMPLVEQSEFNIPAVDRFFTRQTGNILTQFMLPLASRFSKNIKIYGADGRSKMDTGFWSHAPSAQMGDLMSSIYVTHPSLARDEKIVEYYQQHCGTLEMFFRYGERLGITYRAGTASHIPALAQRK